MNKTILTTTDYLSEWLRLKLAIESDLATWRELFDAACLDWRLEEAQHLLRIPKQMPLPPEQLAQVYHGEGILHAQLGDWARSVAVLIKAIDLLENTSHVRRGIMLLNDLGMILRLQGRNEAAELAHKQALELSQTIEALDLEAEALSQLGLDLEHHGEIIPAIAQFEQALTKYQALDDSEELARILNHLGEAQWRAGLFDVALEYLERALDVLGEPPENPHLAAQIISNMGAVRYEQGDLDAAEACWRSALVTVEALNAVFDRVGLLNNLGGLAYSREDYESAHAYFAESLTLALELGDERGVEEARHNLALAVSKLV